MKTWHLLGTDTMQATRTQIKGTFSHTKHRNHIVYAVGALQSDIPAMTKFVDDLITRKGLMDNAGRDIVVKTHKHAGSDHAKFIVQGDLRERHNGTRQLVREIGIGVEKRFLVQEILRK